MSYLVPDDAVPGAFRVMFGPTQQSWVDPSRPDFLVFEYVAQIAIALERAAFTAPDEQRLRVVHLGGGGLTIPRWVEWRRPGTAQVVCEPNTELTEEVRRKVPLQKRSGIKVRDVDGRSGLAAMVDEWADVIIVDAFDGPQVPAELATEECLGEIRRVLRGPALLIFNLTDLAPFPWAKRLAAGVVARWPHFHIGAEPAVHKGRRFGNLLFVASVADPGLTGIRRDSASAPVAYKWLDAKESAAWPGGAEPFTDDDADPSPRPSGSKLWF